jgi:hypothetical protein
MSLLKKLLTPAGALAMIVALWLPWADVSCSQIQTSPTYWQLAGYDHRLYVIAGMIAVVVMGAVAHLILKRRSTAIVVALASACAVAAWIILWTKRDELATYQAQMALQGGDLARLVQDLKVATGSGFKLYLAGAVLALVGAVWWLKRPRSDRVP